MADIFIQNDLRLNTTEQLKVFLKSPKATPCWYLDLNSPLSDHVHVLGQGWVLQSYHWATLKSLIAVIKGASQNLCDATLWQKWSIWPTTDKKGENEQPLQPPSLHCNFCTKAGVMLQSPSSQPCGRRWVELWATELIIGLVVFTFHMSSLAKECALDIRSLTKISIQCLHCQEIKNNTGPLLTSAQISVRGKFPSHSWHIQYTAVCFVNVC